MKFSLLQKAPWSIRQNNGSYLASVADTIELSGPHHIIRYCSPGRHE